MDDEELERLKAELYVSAEKEISTFKDDLIREREGWLKEWDGNLISFKGTLDFSGIAIKSIILVNGGGVLALLTFIGNFWKSEDPISSQIATALSPAIASFLVGVTCGLATALLTYVAQSAFSELPKRDDGKFPKMGVRCRYFAVAFGFVGWLAFSWGAYNALLAFTNVG